LGRFFGAFDGGESSILPETRRKTIPGARRRTSMCADGLGKDARLAAVERAKEPFE
jgi:hypothetical protein